MSIALRRTLAITLLVARVGVRAQAVAVVLREEATRAPIAGIVVRLVHAASQDRVIHQALTNDSGHAVLRAPEAGTYRIRVNRIGYRPMLTDAVSLVTGGTTTRELTMQSIRLALPAVAVRSRSECGDRIVNDTVAATLWEQIQTALSANVLTQSQWSLPLRVTTFRREVGERGEPGRELAIGSAMVRGPPFAPISPDTLARRGFVFASSDGWTFAAPDASVLLSDAFVNGHCFRAVARSETTGELLGLEFEPVRGRRLPDVRGTLWVDRATSELRTLEFSYTNLAAAASEMRSADLGGRLDFFRLSTGAWIVSYWHVRLPTFQVTEASFAHGLRGRPVIRQLVGYVDQGGRAMAVAATEVRQRGYVTGHVFDSTTASPLSGAVVRLEGVTDSLLTDEHGRFHIAVDSGGWYTLRLQHPKLGLVGDSAHRRIPVSLGDTASVVFGVPAAATFARELCGSAMRRDRGALIGIAWGSARVPAEDADLRLVREGSAPNADAEEQTISGPHGIYAFCAAPSGQALVIRVRVGSGADATTRFHDVAPLSPGEVRWFDLRPESR